MTRVFNLPNSLLKRAEELALEEVVSLDVWVTSALAQKIGAVESAAAFFHGRSAGAGKGLNSYLDLIPDNPPMPGDELRGLPGLKIQTWGTRSYGWSDVGHPPIF